MLGSLTGWCCFPHGEGELKLNIRIKNHALGYISGCFSQREKSILCFPPTLVLNYTGYRYNHAKYDVYLRLLWVVFQDAEIS